MKTKFFILGAIASLLSIGTFTNATNYEGMSFTCSLGGEIEGYNQCSDDYMNFDPYIEGDYTFSASSSASFSAVATVANGIFINLENGNTLSPAEFPGTYNLYCNDGGCQNINVYAYTDIQGTTPALATFTLSPVGGEGGGGEGGEGGEGGGVGGIIANGVGAFSGIVNKLGNITTEFVPYLIYIFIALLGISLTINVVKYILGYLKGGAENSITGREGMKARRTWRRQQRRIKYDGKRLDYKGGRYYYTNTGKGTYRRSRKIQNGRIRNNGGF